jgi:predicted metalloprotease
MKNKMMKTVISTAMALVLSASLVGCGSSTSSDSTSSDSAAASESAETTSEEEQADAEEDKAEELALVAAENTEDYWTDYEYDTYANEDTDSKTLAYQLTGEEAGAAYSYYVMANLYSDGYVYIFIERYAPDNEQYASLNNYYGYWTYDADADSIVIKEVYMQTGEYQLPIDASSEVILENGRLEGQAQVYLGDYGYQGVAISSDGTAPYSSVEDFQATYTN